MEIAPTQARRSAAALQVLRAMTSCKATPQHKALVRMLPTASTGPPPAWLRLQDAGTPSSYRCLLAGTPRARRFRDRRLNRFIASTFLQLPAAVAAEGLPHKVALSRFDLHHAHLFAAHKGKGLGLLFHAMEYPAYDPADWSVDLGYCQRGSHVAYDAAGMDWRNLLFFGGRTAAVDCRPGGHLHERLLMDGLKEARTVLEADFGVPLADIYYLHELRSSKSEHRVYIVPR